MRKKTLLKVTFDIFMTFGLLALMAYYLTGNYIHELLGLILVGMFVLHNIFNIKWICSVTKKVFSGEADGFSSAKYIVNLVLLILIVAVGGSGILISQSFFTQLSAGDRVLWVCIHNISAMLTIICVGIHIGLHIPLISATFRTMFGLQKDCFPRKIVLRILAFILCVLGVKAHFSQPFTEYFQLPQDNSDESQSLDNTANKALSSSQLQPQALSLSDNKISVPYIELTRSHGEAYYDFSANPPSESESLEDYLGRLNCTGCSRQCLLTNPQCSTGQGLAQQGTEFFDSYFSSQVQTTMPQTSAPETLQTTPPVTTQSPETQTEEEQESLSDSENSDSSEISSENTDNNETPSLEEYLGKLFCTGCGRQCPLSSPECNTGISQSQKATQDYNSLYTYKDENSSSSDSQQVEELVFEDDSMDSLKNLFTTMIPVLTLYAGTTYYVVKIVRKHSASKNNKK